MIRKILLSIASAAIFSPGLNSQEPIKYQLPPEEIIRIVDAPVTPVVSVSPDKTNILVVRKPPIITISELSEVELRLAGLRINPATGGRSRQTFNKGFILMNIDGSNVRQIS
ncbi:MAG: S9 family peptidase, partial [Bacteroidia bacterium]